PEIGRNDVLIRVEKTSICGTDLHIYEWDEWAQATIPVPLVVGHEFMGRVAAVGDEVEGIREGERVSGEGHITCGHCRNCRAGRRGSCYRRKSVGVSRPGAFADYLVLPAQNVYPLPDHIPDDVAAVLDPLGNATHTALAFDVVGEDVLITGAGPIGVMAAAIARHSGPGYLRGTGATPYRGGMAAAIVRHIGARDVVVTDVNPYRLELAARMGVDRTVDARTEDPVAVMPELGMVEGFDVGLEMSGSEQAFNQLLDAMNHGGKVAVLGIPSGEIRLDVADVIFKGLTMRGIYGRRIFETWYKMAAMLQSGLDVSAVITHRFDAEDYETAFDVVRSGRSGKVLLEWA